MGISRHLGMASTKVHKTLADWGTGGLCRQSSPFRVKSTGVAYACIIQVTPHKTSGASMTELVSILILFAFWTLTWTYPISSVTT